MNFNIKPYKNSDFEQIVSWWNFYKECPPIEGMMIEDGTFILELNNTPAICVTVFLTQSKEICYFEGLIKNPMFKDNNLNEYVKLLVDHCSDYCKNKGYKRVVAFSSNSKLTNKYESFGFNRTLQNLTGLMREL